MSKFEREYFMDGKTGYSLYRDFLCHYITAEKVLERKPSNVIEIGGARGFVCRIIQAHDVSATCLDVSVYCNQNKVVEDFVLADITKDLDLGKKYDLCFSVAVLEHLPEDKLDVAIKNMIACSKRGLHGITFTKTAQDIDETHCTMHPKEWWVERFAKVDANYKVEIIDKEEMEHGMLDLAKSAPLDGLLKLNIGCFTDMLHYGWINIDALDLKSFAIQNGYTFQQLGVANSRIEYDKMTQNVQLAKKIKPLPFSDSTVDVILTQHMLEHYSREEGIEFINECKRMLKNGGLLRIAVVDAKYVSALYISDNLGGLMDIAVEQSRDEAESFYKMVMEGHNTVYDERALVGELVKLGFENVKKVSAFISQSEVITKQTVSLHPTTSLYVEATVKKEVVAVVPKTYNAIRNTKLKVGIVSSPMLKVPPVAYGGLELVVHDLGVALAKLGNDVTIFAPNGSYAEGCKIVQTGEQLAKVQCDWVAAEKAMFQQYEGQLKDFDIVHGNNWFGFEYLAKAKNPDLKVCHTHHGHLNMNWWGQSRPPFKTDMIGISDWMVRAYATQGYMARRCYNGTDDSKYVYQAKKGDRLLFVGRFDEFKRPHVAIDVAKKLGMGIDLVGGSFVQNENYLAMIKAQDGLGGVKIWVDASQEDKIRLYQNARCTIVPSKMEEPFGLVPIESMLCGTPVVASPDGALTETVKTGGVISADDFMADAILNTIPKITPKMARKNGELFSAENMAKAYIQRYNEVISGDEW
jgi:glycosyltransferase involved in cell wall biosynthesis/predicted SAM-dependent methyltransferase